MTILSSQITTLKTNISVSNLRCQFLYPKLVLFETANVVRITDVTPKSETDEANDYTFEFDHSILDHTLLDHLLWLILKSGDIVIIDILLGTKLMITHDNAKYSISSFKTDGKTLLLVSETGEGFAVPYTTNQLAERLKTGTAELEGKIEKVSSPISNFKTTVFTWNGLNMYLDNGELTLECPVTGLLEVIEVKGVKLKHIMKWGNMVVIGNKNSIWFIDLKDSKIAYEVKNDYILHPLGINNNIFYYLTCEHEGVHVWNAWSGSAENQNINLHDSLNNSSMKLSAQETLKAQVLSLLEIILSSDVASSDQQVLQQILTLFGKIEELEFLITSATKLCEHDLIFKPILHPLQKRVHKVEDPELNNRICDLIIKTDLVEYINFKGNNNYECKSLFEKSFKELCVIFVTKSDFDLASICWLKYSEINLSLKADDINDILQSIAYNVKLSTLIIWLKHFVPSVLDSNPYFIDVFVRWTSERIFKLEQSQYWPKIGLKFLDEIMTVLETSLKPITIRPISMDDLDALKDRIYFIMELKEKYKINMFLSELSCQSPKEVAIVMLRRCYTEDLESFLEDYLPSYASQHSFELDDTLHSFIESEAASSGGGVDGSRLRVLLNSFRSYNQRLVCLLKVLRVLDVPWNDIVTDIAIEAAASATKDFTLSESDRSLARDVQKEVNYAKVKVILKKYNFPLSCTDYVLVLHKLINAPTVSIPDLKAITSVMPAYCNYANVIFIDRCLHDCDTREALNYFKQLQNKEKYMLLKATLSKYEQIINGSTKSGNNNMIERNYLDFLKGTDMLNATNKKSVEDLYHLKNSYDISLNLNSLNDELECSQKSTAWINRDGAISSSGRGGCVAKLTQSCQTAESQLLSLLRRTSAPQQERQLIEGLLKYISDEDLSGKDNLGILSQFTDGQNDALLLRCYNVLIDLINNCHDEHLHYLMKLLHTMNALVNVNIVVKNLTVVWKFHYIHLISPSVNTVNDMIQFFSSKLSINGRFFEDICSKNDFTLFRIIANLVTSFSSKLENKLMDVCYNVARKLLSKVTSSQNIDVVLVTNLLLILSYNDNTEDRSWILDTLRGQNECLSASVMGYLSTPSIRRIFALENALTGHTNTYPPQYILKSKFNINLTEISLSDNTEETWDVKVILFYVLKQYPDTTFDRLAGMCQALNVSMNDGLSLQLISLLTTWELKYEIIVDEFGCRQLNLRNTEKYLMNKCSVIWESIDNKDFIKDILNDFWKNGEVTLHGRLVSINPYFFEVYICIYHLIFGTCSEQRNIKEYFLLNFLKDYKRKSTPKQYEFELFSVKGMFPEIGHYRLPFHLFMRQDMWSNLKSEITLETYERWLPVVVLLSLDSDLQTARDMICSNALKQTMTSRKRNEDGDTDLKESEPWRLTTREEPLLRAAHRCVRHIANMEWAGACLFYVLQGCTRGADQVAAAQLCYQFAQRWAALQPGNRAVRQMERLHASLSTRHSLHKIEWAIEDFLRVSTEPAQLIRALYLHPQFVEKMSRHDVNRAANEIADKNGINVSSIRIQILENILEKSHEKDKNQFLALNIKELMTVKYILKATCPKMGAIYLSRIAFDDDTNFNKCKKLRALQCLMSVVEPDTAMKVTSRERDDLWPTLLELLYIVNLENIDMPWITATFTQDKVRALQQLQQVTGGNIEGLKITAELAWRFGNETIILQLIPMLLRSCLHEELIPLLLKLSTPPNEIICQAWRAVLLSPFQRADYPITERQRIKCLNAINLLPVCPVIKDEYLLEIWKNCIRCKCFGLGCLVLPYMTHNTRQTLNELQKIDKRNLIASLKNLQTDTYLVSGAMHVIDSMSLRSYH